MFSVTISEKGGQQSQHEFSKPEITIGRMKGNDIVLPKGNVSKQHTRVFFRDGQAYIVDLKSTNGTYVNGRKVTSEQLISASDKIYIGDFILQITPQPSRAQSAGPPSPPKPPGAPGPSGGQSPSDQRQGGRHFPTVMDADAIQNPAASQPGRPASPSSTGNANPNQSSPGPAVGGAPERPSSTAGSPPSRGGSPSGPGKSSPGQSSPSQSSPGQTSPPQPSTPEPSSPSNGALDDLRRTYGDSAAPVDLQPDIEPLDEPSPEPQKPAVQPLGDRQSDIPTPDEMPAVSIQPAAESPGTLGASAMAMDGELKDEFDDALHRNQVDAARVFFESIPLDDIPTDYPLADPEFSTRARSAARQAAGAVGVPGQQKEVLTEILTQEATGLGPLETFLDDPDIDAIYVNTYDRVVLRRRGELVVADRAFSDPAFLDLCARRLLGAPEDIPLMDEVHFGDGTRAQIMMPPIAVNGPALAIKKPGHYFPTLSELSDQSVMSGAMAQFLSRAVEAGRSMVIAGPVGGGKTTLMSAIAQALPSAARVIAVEQHSSLPLEGPNSLRLEASPETGYDMSFLVSQAIHMHPQRVFLDECRGAEAYDWVTAAASGTEGSVLTLHGTNAIDALGRLESMCLLRADNISPRGLREQVARAVDLVIAINSDAAGGFRVQQIAEVQGVDLDAYRLNDIFYHRVEGGQGAFHPTGYIPLFYEDLRHAGLDVDLGIFRD